MKLMITHCLLEIWIPGHKKAISSRGEYWTILLRLDLLLHFFCIWAFGKEKFTYRLSGNFPDREVPRKVVKITTGRTLSFCHQTTLCQMSLEFLEYWERTKSCITLRVVSKNLFVWWNTNNSKWNVTTKV